MGLRVEPSRIFEPAGKHRQSIPAEELSGVDPVVLLQTECLNGPAREHHLMDDLGFAQLGEVGP